MGRGLSLCAIENALISIAYTLVTLDVCCKNLGLGLFIPPSVNGNLRTGQQRMDWEVGEESIRGLWPSVRFGSSFSVITKL